VACTKTLTPDEDLDTGAGVSHRSARGADLVSLVALDRLCFGDRAWSARGWWEVLASRGWRTIVLTCGAAIVGASVMVLARPTSVLASLAVAPTHRQRGLGRWLLREAVRRSNEFGAAWLSLEVDRSNAAARRLYEREGFGTLRRFEEDGVGRLELLRRLGGRLGH